MGEQTAEEQPWQESRSWENAEESEELDVHQVRCTLHWSLLLLITKEMAWAVVTRQQMMICIPPSLAHLQGHGLQWKAKDELRFPDCEGTQETEEGSDCTETGGREPAVSS